jgi:predicted Rossmann fold nucleotide-binding protein DprA/Smf involved in DNA uptake
MSEREDARKRAEMLKQLREEHRETIARTQALLKEQQAIRRQICQVMRDAPKTVPEVAEATGIPAGQVLWHITAMKKYDLAVETGMDGEYYQYQLVQETKK